ncbi:MAG: amidohydrolase [Clostridia bacterium]|nr:amidohydrolase [Clostridia bacterium]
MIEESYRVIDAHCHIYPDKIAERAVHGTDEFYHLHSLFDGKVSTLHARGNAAGVDHFVVQSVATSPAQVASINHFIADSVAASNGTMTGLGTLHPASDDFRRDVEQVLALNLHGVKLHPDIQQFAIDDPACDDIYALCSEADLPILMHMGDRRFAYSHPRQLLDVMKRFPRLRVCGAHLGGWSVWKEAVDLLAGTPNLFVDTCSSFAWLTQSDAYRIIRAYGADRVMFGTDYPMWDAQKELEFLTALPLAEDEKRQILSENACALWRIDAN